MGFLLEPCIRRPILSLKPRARSYRYGRGLLLCAPRTSSAPPKLNLVLICPSHKFGKKVTYFNDLSELHEHLKYDQLTIPPEVLQRVPGQIRFRNLRPQQRFTVKDANC
ncbi:rho GTPase-activating protein 8 [Tursiops truncatus]|uniref:rho GTPase-activating protein 8 n=1 Tax=Tursiops truncatus TaxID=9739 RepID=UPI003CCF5E64